VLVQALFGSGSGTGHLSDDQFRQSVRRTIQRDFDCARVVEVDGWTMAVAEARLCALISMA
jgi:hypothetical protein